MAEKRTQRNANEAADKAYDDTLVYDEAAYLQPRRPHGPEYPDLPRALEDAHGERVDDPEGGDGHRNAHDGVEEHALAVEVALYLRLPLGVRVQRELWILFQDLLDPALQGVPVGAPPGLY